MVGVVAASEEVVVAEEVPQVASKQGDYPKQILQKNRRETDVNDNTQSDAGNNVASALFQKRIWGKGALSNTPLPHTFNTSTEISGSREVTHRPPREGKKAQHRVFLLFKNHFFFR